MNASCNSQPLSVRLRHRSVTKSFDSCYDDNSVMLIMTDDNTRVDLNPAACNGFDKLASVIHRTDGGIVLKRRRRRKKSAFARRSRIPVSSIQSTDGFSIRVSFPVKSNGEVLPQLSGGSRSSRSGSAAATADKIDSMDCVSNSSNCLPRRTCARFHMIPKPPLPLPLIEMSENDSSYES